MKCQVWLTFKWHLEAVEEAVKLHMSLVLDDINVNKPPSRGWDMDLKNQKLKRNVTIWIWYHKEVENKMFYHRLTRTAPMKHSTCIIFIKFTWKCIILSLETSCFNDSNVIPQCRSTWKNTVSNLSTWTDVWANSINPDQMLQNAASDQGLHCFILFKQV